MTLDPPPLTPAEWHKREAAYRERKIAEVATTLARKQRQRTGKPCYAAGTRYRSITDAAEAMGLSDRSVREWIRTAKDGYRWA